MPEPRLIIRFLIPMLSMWSMLSTPPLPAAEPSFEFHTIDKIGQKMGQTALADMDKDGDLDYLVGQTASRGGDVWWFEYQAPGRWVRHDLGKGNTDVGGAPFDVNGDGWLDFLAGSKLLLNTGDPRQPFTQYEVGAANSHDTAFAEINGDGRMDAYANSDKSGLFWYEIPADPTQKWIEHTIATIAEHKVHGGTWPKAAGDLDGDGDTDLVTAQAWYENLGGKGLEWRRHMEADFMGRKDKYGVAVRTWVIDLDGDKDLDFVQAEADHQDARVAWFENDGKARWTRHMIKKEGEKQDFHSLIVADLDADGDADVFAGGGPLTAANTPKKCYVWENTAGPGKNPGSNWTEHVVLEGKECHDPACGDVDGDGDIDIVFKPWNGDEHVFMRNMAVEKRKR